MCITQLYTITCKGLKTKSSFLVASTHFAYCRDHHPSAGAAIDVIERYNTRASYVVHTPHSAPSLSHKVLLGGGQLPSFPETDIG